MTAWSIGPRPPLRYARAVTYEPPQRTGHARWCKAYYVSAPLEECECGGDVRATTADRWRVVAYDFEGAVRFVAAEFGRREAEDVAGLLIEQDDVASVNVERVTRERGTP